LTQRFERLTGIGTFRGGLPPAFSQKLITTTKKAGGSPPLNDALLLPRCTQWVVFEPNNEALWTKVRQSVGDVLSNLWREGVLPGSTSEQAFFVKCDRTTMTQEDINQGRLICLIGVAPVKPAEFVIFRIGQWTEDRKD
jgi:phage tail sheath protein FI